jgi:hypothetical protein
MRTPVTLGRNLFPDVRFTSTYSLLGNSVKRALHHAFRHRCGNKCVTYELLDPPAESDNLAWHGGALLST